MTLINIATGVMVAIAAGLTILVKNSTERASGIKNIGMFIVLLLVMNLCQQMNLFWMNDLYRMAYEWSQEKGLRFFFGPLLWPVAFLWQDFQYFVAHYLSHQLRPFWGAHHVHHSSKSFNISIGFRHSFLYPLLGLKIFWFPLVLVVGLTPLEASALVSFHFAIQFFGHLPQVQLPKILNLIFVTPEVHAIHHSTTGYRKNFGGVFTIWDHVFRTYHIQDMHQLEFGVGQESEPTGLWQAQVQAVRSAFKMTN